MKDLKSILQQFQPDLEAELKHAISDSSLPLYDMMRYHLGWADEHGVPRTAPAGKRLRPALCLLACRGVGGEWKKALPAAAAIELMHNFSLIHDDIEDASPLRRGKPTVWKIWGEGQAINAGDAMYALARLSLLRLEETGIPAQNVISTAAILDEACLQMCEGQYLDLHYETTLEIKAGDYLDMIEKKTASLFRCSLELGARLGTEAGHRIERLAAFGHDMGVAFQIQNDISGIWGNEDSKIKVPNSKSVERDSAPVLSDIQRKKKTLPVVLALEKAAGADAEQLRDIYRREAVSPADAESVLAILNRAGVRGEAGDVASKYSLQALAHLDASGIDTSTRDSLRAIAATVV